MIAALLAISAACTPAPWPLWEQFRTHFIESGRVVDATSDRRTTSEAQAYAMFFALAAGDRTTFDALLDWTQKQLARGDLSQRLPSWHWDESRNAVVDENSASDADLWLAYDLLEAARIWNSPAYDRLARSLFASVSAKEIVEVPGLGTMLLPGPVGFLLENGHAVRLNPSYLAPQLLRRAATAKLPGHWKELERNSERLLAAAMPNGFAPDWIVWRDGAVAVDAERGSLGSFDAIRIYLWAAMLDAHDPLRARLLKFDAPVLALARARGALPEQIDAQQPQRAHGRAPPGFLAALLPDANARGSEQLAILRAQLDATLADGLYGRPPTYYDQVLALFGAGFVEHRFRFDRDGKVVPGCSGGR